MLKIHITGLLMLLLASSLGYAPSIQAKTFKIATVSPDGLSWMKQLRAGAKEIATKTDGRVKFKIYPGGVQGDDYTVMRKVRIGQLQGGVMAASTLTRFYPDLQIYNLPLQFRDQEEVDYVRARMDDRIIDGLGASGITSFSLAETGFAYMLTSEPVAGIEDLQKVKAWVPDGDPIAARLIQSFGVSPIPLGLPDVLAGLQTGLIDAVAVPPLVALALQWHNHVEYITRLPLMYIYSMLALDQKAFNMISPTDQEIVRSVMNRVFSTIDSDNRRDNKSAYEALLSQGIKEVSPTPEQLISWRLRADASVEKLVQNDGITQDSLDVMRQHLNEFRATQAGKTIGSTNANERIGD
ncbi:MAG: TRAP-type C4-dicarboxylate transport system substrate-binding protein [Candidatus Azotimanducaceae bacterium]|jgi:TRAP-type C4-dicarboxylate transport system substrate-binding protein